MVTTAFIGLGSNLGDRANFTAQAVKLLGTTSGVRVARATLLQETKPIGPIKQGKFLNGVVRIETLLGPIELLDALMVIERKLGRVRKERWGSRTIDLDILLYGDRIIDHPRLRVPHPEIQYRPFVMEGLHEVGGFYSSFPAVSGGESMDPLPEAAGDDVRNENG